MYCRSASSLLAAARCAGNSSLKARGKYRYQHTNSFARAGLQPITTHAALGTSYMTTPPRNESALLLRSASPLRPMREQRITNLCRKSHLLCMATAEKQQEQRRQRRESPLRIVIIIISGFSVIVIISKSTKPAREAQEKKGLHNVRALTRPKICLQSIRNSHDFHPHCRRLEDWRGPVVWLPPASPLHERFSSFAGSAPNLPRLALAFAFPSRNPGRVRAGSASGMR